MALGAAHAGQLVQVRTFTRAAAGTPLDLVRHPRRGEAGANVRASARAQPGAQLGIPRELPSLAAKAVRIADASEVTRLAVARPRSPVPPARVATTGRAAASDSIATTGVPSFPEVRNKASNAAYQDGSALEADEPTAVGDAELGASASTAARSSPSPTSTSSASTSRSTSARSVRTRSSGRLIAVSRPAHRTTNVSSPAPISSRIARRAFSSASPHVGGRSRRERRRSAVPGDAEADELVTHLVADGDERSRRVGKQAFDPAEDALPAPAEVAAEDVAVVGVDDARAGGRSRRRAAARRPVAPALAVCV